MRRIRLGALLASAGLLLAAGPVRADQYRGNGNTGFDGAIGNGTLTLTDDGTNISGILTVGGSMNDVLVLYIQTGPGGFADTAGFNDQSDSCRQGAAARSAAPRNWNPNTREPSKPRQPVHGPRRAGKHLGHPVRAERKVHKETSCFQVAIFKNQT